MEQPTQVSGCARSEIDAVMTTIGPYLGFVSGTVPRAPEWVCQFEAHSANERTALTLISKATFAMDIANTQVIDRICSELEGKR
jgi:hypothetical protein